MVPWQTYGIYIDGFASGVTVQGNIITRVDEAGIYINGGSDNRVLNNVIVDCLHPSGAPDNNNFELFARADLSFWSSKLSDFNTGYWSVNGQSAWASMPGMTVAPSSHVDAAGLVTWSNVFIGNVISYNTTYPSYAYYLSSIPFDRNTWNSNVVYHYGAEVDVRTNSLFPAWAQWQSVPQDAQSITNDPQLGTDFFVASSTALALGIQSVSINGVGIVSSASASNALPIVAGSGLSSSVVNGKVYLAASGISSANMDAATAAQLARAGSAGTGTVSVPLLLQMHVPEISTALSLSNSYALDANLGVGMEFDGYQGFMAGIRAYNNPQHTVGGALEFDTANDTTTNVALTLDRNGNAAFSGTLTASSAVLTGSFSGIFSGTVNASNGMPLVIGAGLSSNMVNGQVVLAASGINSSNMDASTAAQLALAGTIATPQMIVHDPPYDAPSLPTTIAAPGPGTYYSNTVYTVFAQAGLMSSYQAASVAVNPAMRRQAALVPAMCFASPAFYCGPGLDYTNYNSETNVLAIASWMSSHGYIQAGYNFIQIDGDWARLDATNNCIVNPLYPHGIPWLINQLKQQYGLGLGVYCGMLPAPDQWGPGFNLTNAFGDGFRYGSWGVKQVKLDFLYFLVGWSDMVRYYVEQMANGLDAGASANGNPAVSLMVPLSTQWARGAWVTGHTNGVGQLAWVPTTVNAFYDTTAMVNCTGLTDGNATNLFQRQMMVYCMLTNAPGFVGPGCQNTPYVLGSVCAWLPDAQGVLRTGRSWWNATYAQGEFAVLLHRAVSVDG